MNQTIRLTCKDLAGAFWDQGLRSPMFRRAFPTAHDYIHGIRHKADGSVVKTNPNWWQFKDLAVKLLAKQLTDPNISEHQKNAITEALIDNAKRGRKASAKRVMQIDLERREDQKEAYTPGLVAG
jgi:hypothetical protein